MSKTRGGFPVPLHRPEHNIRHESSNILHLLRTLAITPDSDFQPGLVSSPRIAAGEQDLQSVLQGIKGCERQLLPSSPCTSHWQ